MHIKLFYMCRFIIKGYKSSLDYMNYCHCSNIFFFWHRISLGILASRRTGLFAPPYSARKIAASNIVDPRLVTVKHTGDPNQSSRLCVRNDVVIGVSVHSWAIRCTVPPRASRYIRHTARTVSRSHAPSLYYSFDNDYGRLSTRRLLRHPLVSARERVWQRFSRVSLEPRRETRQEATCEKRNSRENKLRIEEPSGKVVRDRDKRRTKVMHTSTVPAARSRELKSINAITFATREVHGFALRSKTACCVSRPGDIWLRYAFLFTRNAYFK